VIGRIANLAVWEWFKLRRRWMLWILLVFAILFAQLAVWGSFFSYQNLQSTGGEITVPASLQSAVAALTVGSHVAIQCSLVDNVNTLVKADAKKH